MKKLLLVLLLLPLVITVKAQQVNKPTDSLSGQSPNIKQETAPEPPGGTAAFAKYLKKYANREYNNAQTGKVTVSFVVESDGSLTGYKITHALNAEADGIAIEVLKDNNQKWKPAIQKGQPVSMPFTIVVPFGTD
jgi:TonB family protein